MSEDQALALTGTLAAMVLVVGSLMVRRFRCDWRGGSA